MIETIKRLGEIRAALFNAALNRNYKTTTTEIIMLRSETKALINLLSKIYDEEGTTGLPSNLDKFIKNAMGDEN